MTSATIGTGAEDARSVAAATWLAQRVLDDSGRDRGFSEWLSADSENGNTYARAEAIWGDLDAVVAQGRSDAKVVPLRPRRPRWIAPALAIAASLVLCFIGLMTLRPEGRAFETKVGERRIIVLEDDSRVTLNTNSRINVSMSAKERVIRLERGEAFFDVAHDAGRPFYVRAQDDEVRAIGTRFIVRRDGVRLAVTLLEGKVAVRNSKAAPIMLAPGDRLVLGAEATQRDRPYLATVTGWQRGELVLRETPIGEAVREMNRYSPQQIRMTAPGVAQAKLTGVFAVGKSAEFARTLSALYGLDLRERDGEIALSSPLQKK